MLTIQSVLSRAQRDVIELPQRMADADSQVLLKELFTGVQDWGAPLVKGMETIERNTKLTLEGKREQYAALSTRARKGLDFLETLQQRVQSGLAVITGRLHPTPPVLSGTDAILQRMDFQEIRRRYEDKPQAEIDGTYLQIDPLSSTAQALVTAPTGPMVSPEIIERRRAEWAKEQDRGLFEQVEAKGEVLVVVSSYLEHCQKALEHLAGYKVSI